MGNTLTRSSDAPYPGEKVVFFPSFGGEAFGTATRDKVIWEIGRDLTLTIDVWPLMADTLPFFQFMMRREDYGFQDFKITSSSCTIVNIEDAALTPVKGRMTPIWKPHGVFFTDLSVFDDPQALPFITFTTKEGTTLKINFNLVTPPQKLDIVYLNPKQTVCHAFFDRCMVLCHVQNVNSQIMWTPLRIHGFKFAPCSS